MHAGLDLLLSEMKQESSDGNDALSTITISRSSASLIQDIFSASESAINILNDLLQYEHVDAG